MFKTILFDFYDVIRIDPYKKWLADHGYKREGEFYDVAAKYDRGLINFSQLMEELSLLSGSPAHEIDQAFKSASQFDDDVIDLIEKLYPEYKIGLISNAGGPGLRRIISERGIEDLFHEIIISGEVGHIKPEPEIFKLALEKLDTSASETIFIDDNRANCVAAQDLGIESIQFMSYPQLISELQIHKVTLSG